MKFDASIDLVDGLFSAGAPTKTEMVQAAERVRRAVEALPGSGWISVEPCLSSPAGSGWLRLYRRGQSKPQSGGDWDALAEQVQRVVRSALASD